MIIERMAKSIRTRSWLTVFIEFSLVVVGVLVALQFDNWNTELENEEKAEQYHVRLLHDLNVEKNLVADLQNYFSTVKTHAVAAVGAMESGQAGDSKAFVIDVYQASQIDYGRAARSTYNEMVANGDLKLLPAGGIRAEIMEYYGYAGLNQQVFTNEPPYRQAVREVIPHDVQAEIRKQCGDRYVTRGNRASFELAVECEVNLPPAVLEATVQAVLAEPQLPRLLRFNLSTIDAKLTEIENFLGKIQRIIDQLEQPA